MPKDSLKDLRVVVAGGSLGGLCAGVALRGQGANVDIFERNPGEMETRGAGIVVQQELTTLLQRHGAPPLPTTSCRSRRYLGSELRIDESSSAINTCLALLSSWA